MWGSVDLDDVMEAGVSSVTAPPAAASSQQQPGLPCEGSFSFGAEQQQPEPDSPAFCTHDASSSSTAAPSADGSQPSCQQGPQQAATSTSQDSDTAGPAAGPPPWNTSLHLPLWISGNERQQIEARLEAWVDCLEAVGADVEGLARVLAKPLRPLWLSPASAIWVDQVGPGTGMSCCTCMQAV
jgi:hypothetical protein